MTMILVGTETIQYHLCICFLAYLEYEGGSR